MPQEAKKERERQRELLRQDYRDRFGREVGLWYWGAQNVKE